jgi:drug/metabolite transporter, DME family
VNRNSITTPIHLPWLGTSCCLLSAVFYSAANIFLRQLAELEADPAWVICLKETTAVLIVGPWLLWQLSRGVRPTCNPRALRLLILTALAVQLIGNLGIQWAFGIVGLIISLPIVFSTLLIGSALMGVILLHESLSTRSVAAMTVVISSIVLLSIGVAQQSSTATSPSGPLLTALAIATAGVGGMVYAGMGATLRYAANARVSIPVMVVVVTGTGTITLGILSLVRLGPAEMLATDRTVVGWIIASGLCNVIAFLFITKGLQLTTLAHANVLNASQVAFGALAGILLFREPYNSWLLSGVALTIFGIGLFGQPQKQLHTKSQQQDPQEQIEDNFPI